MPKQRTIPVNVRPVVAMCAGKDCRKRCEFAKMHDELAERCDVVDLGCVGICNGPVVVVDPAAEQPLVLSKLRKKQHGRLVSELATSGSRPGGGLRSHVVTGSKRKSTLKKVRRRLPAA